MSLLYHMLCILIVSLLDAVAGLAVRKSLHPGVSFMNFHMSGFIDSGTYAAMTILEKTLGSCRIIHNKQSFMWAQGGFMWGKPITATEKARNASCLTNKAFDRYNKAEDEGNYELVIAIRKANKATDVLLFSKPKKRTE